MKIFCSITTDPRIVHEGQFTRAIFGRCEPVDLLRIFALACIIYEDIKSTRYHVYVSTVDMHAYIHQFTIIYRRNESQNEQFKCICINSSCQKFNLRGKVTLTVRCSYIFFILTWFVFSPLLRMVHMSNKD